MGVANFPRFLAPEMVPSRMSNLAVGLWSGLNDLRDDLGEAFLLRLFGCFSICGSYTPGLPGMCLWKWRSVSWSGNLIVFPICFLRRTKLFFSSNLKNVWCSSVAFKFSA